MTTAAAAPAATYQTTVTEVRVVGFNMPFFNLVGFFIKAALAAIPAAIIVAIIWVVIAAVLFGGFAGMLGRHA